MTQVGLARVAHPTWRALDENCQTAMRAAGAARGLPNYVCSRQNNGL